MRRGSQPSLSRSVHPPKLFDRLFERIRGREQILVRPMQAAPLLLVTYPRGREAVARHLEVAYTHTLPALPLEITAPYTALMTETPALVVVLLRPTNPCGCLGHYHPRGAESRLSRRLSADLGGAVGEIDLAYESIRQWEPHPISSLAAAGLGDKLPLMHFEAAILAVLLHELHHMAAPQKGEKEIRSTSNQFYVAVMGDLVRHETGHDYGMIGAPAAPVHPR